MKSIKLKVEVILTIELADGLNISPDEIIQEMDYDFKSNTGGANIDNTEIRSFTIVDAK